MKFFLIVSTYILSSLSVAEGGGLNSPVLDPLTCVTFDPINTSSPRAKFVGVNPRTPSVGEFFSCNYEMIP